MNCLNTTYIAKNENILGQNIFPTLAPDTWCLRILKHADQQEVLEFLQIRPVHTVVMSSFIKDNGLENADNRGSFYGYRSRAGKLEGVALI